jgi:hypothetical protein
MKEQLKNWWVVLLKGIILILLAIYVFQHPVGTLVGIALYIGIATLVDRCFSNIRFSSRSKGGELGLALGRGYNRPDLWYCAALKPGHNCCYHTFCSWLLGDFLRYPNVCRLLYCKEGRRFQLVDESDRRSSDYFHWLHHHQQLLCRSCSHYLLDRAGFLYCRRHQYQRLFRNEETNESCLTPSSRLCFQRPKDHF